ncbi:MAG: hypothetical protein K0S76_1661 [Herbinix sp.]|jgi:hypothetical protein|nr:hypothetical protein [Herbinix sp.]
MSKKGGDIVEVLKGGNRDDHKEVSQRSSIFT